MFNILNEFTGYQYMLIHLANCFGLDKLTFEERIDWAEDAIHKDMEELAADADTPFTFRQAFNEIHSVRRGNPTGLLVELDATSSFLQFMAALSGCEKSAYASNMIDPEVRVDAYTMLTEQINKAMEGFTLTREQAKDLFMKSTAYGSRAIPESIFPNENLLMAYYNLMHEHYPGVMAVRQEFLNLWDPTAMFHTCTMPDGHTFHVPVKVMYSEKLEIGEVAPYNNGKPKSVTFRHAVHEPSEYSTPILANLTQAYDAWMVRYVRQRCWNVGVELVTIHDGFRCHPEHMGIVRHCYREGMIKLAEGNYLETLVRQMTKDPKIYIHKMSLRLPELLLNSRYLLS